MSRKRGTVVVVRKIQLLVDTQDAEEVNAVRQKIYGWQEICFQPCTRPDTHEHDGFERAGIEVIEE